ncbi:hypothetical protein C6341_g25372 [Phytophthora cactorum]|nr:hypothetical protein C6341_g25372 [Phytophthora cactorum]
MLHVREYPPSAGELHSAQPAQGSAEPNLWLVAGKRRLPVGRPTPTGKELSSVGPLGGRGQQDPAPKRAGLSYEKSVCKPGLLVVQANVKDFEKPWRVLIDSGASGNYTRRSTLEGSQQYAEALEAQTTDTISVRLATGNLITVSKVSVDLGVKFLDFDSVERCLVLYLDSRYDLILGMAWLERHEPWIDWRSKTLGTTHFATSGAVVSHEPTSARKQKHFWREHEAESAMVLDIGMSELVSNEVAVFHERGSQDVRGAARYPRSGADLVSDPLLCPDEDKRGAARNPLSGTDLVNDLPVRAPESRRGVAHNLPSGVEASWAEPGRCRWSGTDTTERVSWTACSELRVSRDTDSSLRTAGAVAPERGDGDVTTPTSSGWSRSRRERRMRTQGLYTLVNGVTGRVDGDISLDSLPAVNALLELDEMSVAEFDEVVKKDALAEVVVIRPEEELNSSSAVDEAEYTDVVSKKPPMGLPPDRGVRHEIDLVPGTKYCVTRQWPLPKEQCDVIDAFFRAKHETGLVRESKSPHSTPTFCVRKPNGKWRTVHAFNKLNAATIPAQTPIPRKDVLQNNMVSCTLYSALDLVDGYYQLLMRACDVPLTAVSTPSGMLWEWLVMPQGMSNAPATFNRLVTQLFRPHRAYAQTYVDDIFVHTRAGHGKSAVENHMEHLRAVLECMRNNKLHANLDKCVFGAEEIPFLSCFIGKRGLRADPAKVNAIVEGPVPKNQKDLRKWLGLANYLQNYSANYDRQQTLIVV